MSYYLPKEFYDNLIPGETIQEILKKFTLISKPDYVVLTDKRIIFFDEKHFGRYDFIVIPFTKLSAMRAEKGIFFFGSIELEQENGELIYIPLINKNLLEPFVVSLENAINEIAIEPISIMRNRRLFGRMEWNFEKPAELLFRSMNASVPQLYSKPDVNLSQDPIEALNLRYAKGEISEEQFKRMRKILEEQRYSKK